MTMMTVSSHMQIIWYRQLSFQQNKI